MMPRRDPHRMRLSRRLGYRLPPDTVRVTRPGVWGNPFKVGEPGVPDPITAVDRFRRFMEEALRTDNPARASMLSALRDLRGKNLACWCHLGSPCHADVLLELANKPDEEMR